MSKKPDTLAVIRKASQAYADDARKFHAKWKACEKLCAELTEERNILYVEVLALRAAATVDTARLVRAAVEATINAAAEQVDYDYAIGIDSIVARVMQSQ